MDRLTVNVTADGRVFITWSDTETSGTLRLTADQAQATGEAGALARARADGVQGE